MTQENSDVVVIYHGDCLDGFCAAWVCWRHFGHAAQYVPAKYGQPPPDVAGKRVVIVDFSYSYEVTLQLISQAASVLMLDHHVTAERDLARIPNGDTVQVVFDMKRSGAGLARDHFFPGLPCWIVDYTQDRDLWLFALPQSKEVNAYLGVLPESFIELEYVHARCDANQAAVLGAGAMAYKQRYVEKMALHARRGRFAGFDDIPIVNAPFVGLSELVGALAESALFAVGWFQRGDGKVVYSLRSRNGFDVSALAEKFGGGGHPAAAGFQLDWPVPEVELP
jgi:oligoribonuclease NrnB/cAMP/cGMP phosphodiesterase (DHH superfamily)